jgi:hypothetical protein
MALIVTTEILAPRTSAMTEFAQTPSTPRSVTTETNAQPETFALQEYVRELQIQAWLAPPMEMYVPTTFAMREFAPTPITPPLVMTEIYVLIPTSALRVLVLAPTTQLLAPTMEMSVPTTFAAEELAPTPIIAPLVPTMEMYVPTTFATLEFAPTPITQTLVTTEMSALIPTPALVVFVPELITQIPVMMEITVPPQMFALEESALEL